MCRLCCSTVKCSTPDKRPNQVRWPSSLIKLCMLHTSPQQAQLDPHRLRASVSAPMAFSTLLGRSAAPLQTAPHTTRCSGRGPQPAVCFAPVQQGDVRPSFQGQACRAADHAGGTLPSACRWSSLQSRMEPLWTGVSYARPVVVGICRFGGVTEALAPAWV